MTKFYDHTDYPAPASRGTSEALRAEFQKVEQGFDSVSTEIDSISAQLNFTSGNISFTPVGNISSTNLQGAVAELDAEKAGIAINNNFTGANTYTGLMSLGNNLSFNGSGQRITGDFSNATLADRLLFQNSVTNAGSSVGVIPNGTGVWAAYNVFAGSNVANTSFAQLRAGTDTEDVRIISSATGTGTLLPMTFYTGGSEKMRIDTNGDVGIGGLSDGAKLHVFGNQKLRSSTPFTGLTIENTNSAGGLSYLEFAGIGGVVDSYIGSQHSTNYSSIIVFGTQPAGSATDRRTNKLLIDGVGNVTALSPTGALGYGTGAGGTVTQLTSKSTAVILNRPTGQITMNNASLAAGASAVFVVTNSIVAPNDVVVLSYFNAGGDLYRVDNPRIAAGGFLVRVTNISAGALADAVVINFAVIKGATS